MTNSTTDKKGPAYQRVLGNFVGDKSYLESDHDHKEAPMVKESDRDWAWDKAQKVRGKNPNLFRRDELGNEIYKPAFGTSGEKGWEIDHRNPKSKGGTDHRRNLRVLKTEANREKGDKT